MSYVDPNYSDTDAAALEAYYTETYGDDYLTYLDSDIYNMNTPLDGVTLEDMLAFRIETTDEIPEFMSDPDPDDPNVQALWADDDFVTAADNWRVNDVVDNADLSDSLKSFLSPIEDTSLASDWSKIYTEYQNNKDEESNGSDIVLTNMMDIALQMGNPVLALIIYMTGDSEHKGFNEASMDFNSAVTDQLSNNLDQLDDLQSQMESLDLTDQESTMVTLPEINNQISALNESNKTLAGMTSTVMDMSSTILDLLSSLEDNRMQTSRKILS